MLVSYWVQRPSGLMAVKGRYTNTRIQYNTQVHTETIPDILTIIEATVQALTQANSLYIALGINYGTTYKAQWLSERFGALHPEGSNPTLATT